MQVIIQRKKPNDVCMFGELSVDYGTRFCYTLERRPDDPEHPAIQAGEYQASIYWSPHLDRQVLLLQDVPGRSEIEIHNGNYVKDSHGCVLVGLELNEEDRAVLLSRTALSQLLGRVLRAHQLGQRVTVLLKDAA